MTELQIIVHGRPAPEGSHEQGANGHIMHSSRYLEAWRAAVNRDTRKTYVANGITPADMPLFPYPRPLWVTIWHLVGPDQCRAASMDEPTGKPDGDKLLRGTVDGLGDAHAFGDDSQIVGHRTFKIRATGHVGACVQITDERPWWAHENEGEHKMMSPNGEYRISLERVGTDADGDRTWETLVEVTDTVDAVRDVWLPSMATRLGAETQAAQPLPAVPVDVETGSAPAEDKPKRTRRNAAQIAADKAAAEASVTAAPITEPEPGPVAALAAEVLPPMPGVPVAPHNPFARPTA